MRNANTGSVWGHGLANGVIVAVMPMITSGMSEGPLGYRGYGLDEWMSLFPERGTKLASQEAHRIIPIMAKPPANRNQGKAGGDGHTRSLEPDWGNPAVRHLRGAEGNLAIRSEG
jgi:hypothetical protein